MLSSNCSKRDKEKRVLLGLVDLYLKLNKPVGSNTLRQAGFDYLSSATIRNYFSHLETEGFLKQQHTSGGRVPTDKAYKLYADEVFFNDEVDKDDDLFLSSILLKNTREIPIYLQGAVEALSEMTGLVSFIASPRFDQDFIVNMKIVNVDEKRALCIILTDFSLIHTEVVYLPRKMSSFDIRRLEEYFHFRLTGLDKPEMDIDDEEFAKRTYNEVVLRHFVAYTNMQFEDVYKSGFSKLILHPGFQDPTILSNTLSLFENSDTVRSILKECFNKNNLVYWIGEDLERFINPPFFSSVVAIPYHVHGNVVGAVAMMGPDRLPYGRIFGILRLVSKYLSNNLTDSIYKYKLNFLQPRSKRLKMHQATSAPTIGLTHQPSVDKNE